MLQLPPAVAGTAYEVGRVILSKDRQGLFVFVLLDIAVGSKVSARRIIID